MAEYNVTSPDGTKYRVTGPDGASEAEVLAQVKAYKPAGATPAAAAAPTPAKPAEAPPAPAKEPGMADFVLGNINKGVANLAGMPVDVARNLANLGIAGAGTIQGAIGGKPPDLIPETSPGGSQWLQSLMQRGKMIGPGAEPESIAGRYGAAALQALPAALIGRPPNAIGALRQGTAAATSGMAGELGADIGGEAYRGPASMLPGFRTMQEKSPGERATAARKAERFGKAKDMGIPIPPREMAVDKPQQSIQDLANRHLGQPPGTEITPETLKAYRNAYVPDYKAAFKSPPLIKGLIPSKGFQAEIQRLGDEISSGTQELPQTFKGIKEATRLLSEYGYAQMPAGVRGIVPPRAAPIPAANVQRAIRTMREGASANFAAGGENNLALARAQKGIANALEGLVEENLQRTGQTALMEKFRTARTQMAKSFDIEESLDPSTRKLSGARLSSSMTGGRPISGELRDLAEVSGQFPGAVKTPQQEGDLFTRRVSPMAITHPPAAAAHWATRIADPVTMSRPYQALVVDPRNKITPEQERMIRAIIAAQGANRGIPPPPE